PDRILRDVISWLRNNHDTNRNARRLITRTHKIRYEITCLENKKQSSKNTLLSGKNRPVKLQKNRKTRMISKCSVWVGYLLLLPIAVTYCSNHSASRIKDNKKAIFTVTIKANIVFPCHEAAPLMLGFSSKSF
ncbi:MAG: hypothetical protein JXX14_25380, partial [Deltaproteobacteria bacterium]|nr:hypothetical protein [Deltaproteobacteria bacterium]